jgi:hypothetical protein
MRAVPGVIKNYEKISLKGWQTSPSEYEYAGKDLKKFINNILGKDLRILESIPSYDILENAMDFKPLNYDDRKHKQTDKYRYNKR